ncbi:hypothetical protein [Tepidimonas sp.]|uniref:hypothetical protein n=1 Tax=Tepidimonas sp. TaxID=2002775 RepID=UPI003918A7C7
MTMLKSGGSEPSPDFKGIKTVNAPCGLSGLVCPNQALISKGLRRIKPQLVNVRIHVRTKP